MKVRSSAILLCAVAFAVVALFLFSGKKSEMTPLPSTTETNGPPAEAERAGTDRHQRDAKLPTRTTAQAAQSPAPPNAPLSPPQSKAEQMKEGLAKFNDADVVLYGRAVDQFGSPVANAVVSGIIQVNNGVRVGTDRMSTTTDSSGLFSISGYTGKNLGVNITKPGYVLATTSTSFVYSHLWPEVKRHVPDPNNPVIFKMWKLQGAEPLVAIDKEYRLPFGSQPLCFDLLKGGVSGSGGDLQVIITRAAGSLSKRNPGDWSVRFVPIGGGIIETDYATSRVTYEAPANGYQSNAIVQMDHNDPAWFDNIQKVFFLKSRNDQVYSKFALDLRINNEPDGLMWFRFRGAASTNGSRNWEATAPQAQ